MKPKLVLVTLAGLCVALLLNGCVHHPHRRGHRHGGHYGHGYRGHMIEPHHHDRHHHDDHHGHDD